MWLFEHSEGIGSRFEYVLIPDLGKKIRNLPGHSLSLSDQPMSVGFEEVGHVTPKEAIDVYDVLDDIFEVPTVVPTGTNLYSVPNKISHVDSSPV